MVKKITDIKSKQKINKPKFLWTLKSKPKKSTFIFIVVILFFLFNGFVIFKQGTKFISEITTSSKQGIASLMNAKDNAKLANFEQAQLAFLEAEKIFTQINQNSWFLTQDLKTPEALISSAQLLAKSGTSLASLGLSFKDLPDQFLSLNAEFLADKNLESTPDLTKPIQDAIPVLNEIQSDLNQIAVNLNTVNSTFLPTQLKKDFLTAKSEINDLKQILANFNTYLEVILDLLGSQVPHTYLVLIQNNYEQRPTGGFIGTLVFAEVDNGILKEFSLSDVYDYDGIFVDNPNYLPPEYEGFNEKLWIRDANYTPDFAISAARIETLLQRASAPSFDTIIAIDQSFIESVLELTGPIPLDNYSGQITANNYFSVLTYLVEANKFDNENDKEILKNFITNFEQKLFKVEDFSSLFQVVSDNLVKKHLQIFSKKEFIQTKINNLKATFSPPKINNSDYLLITNTSIGGNKTDKYIKQRYIHNTHFNPNNSIQNSITIRKFHSFTDREELVWQNNLRPFGVTKLVDFTRYILGRGDNVSMVKVFVPKGTKLDKVEGIQRNQVQLLVDPDLNQPYFLFKMSVKPGKTEEITLTYSPDIKLKPNPATQYNLFLQSQAGSFNTIFEKTYSFADNTKQKIYMQYPSITSYTDSGVPSSQFDFESDIQLKAVYATN